MRFSKGSRENSRAFLFSVYNLPIGRRSYWIAFALCAAASALPFLVTPRLPMIDLPQHAAQISLWKHFDEPCYRFADIYRFDWMNPYLAGYTVVRLLAVLFSVNTALKITIYLAVVAMPLSLRYLLRSVSDDASLSLLGFPLAFGFTFYWGFLNFFVALPIAIAYLAVLYRSFLNPAASRVVLQWAWLVLLLFAHAVLAAYCIAATIILATFSRSMRAAAMVAAPALLTIPALLLWTARLRASDITSHHVTYWNFSARRLLHFPSMLLSSERDVHAEVFVALVVVIVAMLGGRFTGDLRRWIIAVTAAAAYLLAPESAGGRAFIFQRFAIFVAAGLFFVLDVDPARRLRLRPLLVIAIVGWMVLLASRFQRFSAEAAELNRVIEILPANCRLAFYVPLPASVAVPGAVFLHFPAYYQVQKGGVLARSFANIPPMLIRHREDAAPVLRDSVLSDPADIDWQGLSAFDFVLIRARREPTPALAAHAPYRLLPVLHTATWWLYATPRGLSTRQSCPPLE